MPPRYHILRHVVVLAHSVLFNEDAIIMWADSPVFRMVVLIRIVFLVVAIAVDASSDKSMPVNAL